MVLIKSIYFWISFMHLVQHCVSHLIIEHVNCNQINEGHYFFFIYTMSNIQCYSRKIFAVSTIYVFCGRVIDIQGIFMYLSAAEVSMCIRNASSLSEPPFKKNDIYSRAPSKKKCITITTVSFPEILQSNGTYSDKWTIECCL